MRLLYWASSSASTYTSANPSANTSTYTSASANPSTYTNTNTSPSPSANTNAFTITKSYACDGSSNSKQCKCELLGIRISVSASSHAALRVECSNLP